MPRPRVHSLNPLPVLWPFALAFWTMLLLPACGPDTPSTSPDEARVDLIIDTDEAAVAIELAHRLREGDDVSADLDRLYDTEAYRRLHEREAAMGRAFTDSAFVAFLSSDSLHARLPALERTLEEWGQAVPDAAAELALAYLPDEARIAAKVYVVVKPQRNSFVWDLQNDPAIFMYLDPDVSGPKFANTVAHELHHVGFAGVGGENDSILARMPPPVRTGAQWMGAFGEGFAMLAAAGDPDTHPHATSPTAERERWDEDVSHFNRDVGRLEEFLLDVMTGRVTDPDSIRAVAITFYGIQGPWYTVGWRMAAEIERYFGREELIRCMIDPRLLLHRYNEAAAAHNSTSGEPLAMWSAEILRLIGEPTDG